MHLPPPTHVGIFEAKTHLSDLIERVRSGESFLVTKHGVPVARLLPLDCPVIDPTRVSEADAGREREAFARLRELRAGVTLGPSVTIKQLIEEGRPR